MKFVIEPLYWISNMGRVYSENSGLMSPSTSSNGYKIVKMRSFVGKNNNITKHVHIYLKNIIFNSSTTIESYKTFKRTYENKVYLLYINK